MAERRMFAKSIIKSDEFTDMPAEAQMLYFRLNLDADDDGFCDRPKAIMRECGASEDSMKLLIAKKFVIAFSKHDSVVVVIKHWRVNNYIRKDSYHETKYREFLRELYFDENQAYSLNAGDGHVPCIPGACDEPETFPSHACDEPVTGASQVRDESLTEDRIGKDSIIKGSIGKDNISPPIVPPKGGCDIFVQFSDGDPDLLHALRAFEAMRKKIRKPMTDEAKKLLISKLKAAPEEDRIPMLQEAILHAWQSVYPLKSRKSGNTGTTAEMLHDSYAMMKEWANG